MYRDRDLFFGFLAVWAIQETYGVATISRLLKL